MSADLTELRELMLADDELRQVCTELLTSIAHGDLPVETFNFNVVDATVNRKDQTVKFEGVLSVNDRIVALSTSRFVELAGTIAAPHSGDALAEWQQRRRRRAWPMPGPE